MNPAGQLRNHLGQWRSICQNRYLLKVIEEGLELEVRGGPLPSFRLDRECAEHWGEMEKVVQDYLERGVIKEVHPAGQSTYPFFLIQQGEKLRPILDLRPLNKFIRYHHFKMEGIQVARTMIREQDWFCKIDLKDAYHSVSLSPRAKQHLGFKSKGRVYQFQVLPFGLTSAPRMFTKLMTAAVKPLREEGIRLVFYLDDILIMGRTEEETRSSMGRTVDVLKSLGFTINEKKSITTPTQEMTFLGMALDSRSMKISVPKEKIRKLKSELKKALAAKKLKMRKLAALAGLLTATAAGFEPCYINQRFIQANMILFQKRGYSWDSEIPILRRSKEELLWWSRRLEELNGRPLLEAQETPIHVFTDASLSGWGYYSDSFSGAGFWNQRDQGMSSNFRELKTVKIMLEREGKRLSNKSLILHSDNTTTISQIVRQSNPRHPKLIKLAKKIWKILLEKRIRLKAIHIKGEENREADLLSRLSIHEWKLDPKIFRRIEGRFGRISVDLFACHRNAQTEAFCSMHNCPEAIAQDAFSLEEWPGNAFANPPPILINRVLQFSALGAQKLVLLTPTWPSQTWWAECLQRSTRKPLEIRVTKSTASIRGRSCTIPYQSLTAWQLSPRPWRMMTWR